MSILHFVTSPNFRSLSRNSNVIVAIIITDEERFSNNEKLFKIIFVLYNFLICPKKSLKNLYS